MRRQISLFALALVLPILAFVGFLLWQYATAEQHRLESEALDLARGTAISVDRELTGLLDTAKVLALSPYLQDRDLAAFYRQAEQVKQEGGMAAVLRDPSGQQVVNLHAPFGTPLPKATLPGLDAALLQGKGAAVSNLTIGAYTRVPQFVVGVPVLRDGKVAYLLTLSLNADHLDQLIQEEAPPATWVIAIVDRNGVIMARSAQQAAFVGKEATRDLRENAKGPSGSWWGLTIDGRPVFGAYARSRLAGWYVAVGVRRSDLDGPLTRSLALFAVLGAALAGLSLLLGFGLGGRITAPIRGLADRATALGRGEPVTPVASAIPEVRQVGRALVAAAALRERETALRESEARYRIILESASEYAVITTDMAGRITTWNTGAHALLGWEGGEVVGQDLGLLFTVEDRLAGVPEAQVGRALRDGRASDERWRVRKDGTRFWASGTLLPLRSEGRTLGLLCILRDRTEQRQVEERVRTLNATLEQRVAARTAELVAANARLRDEAAERERVEEQLRQSQKMEAVGRLTGGVAHDFNNLLTVIMGSLEMLVRRLPEADARARAALDAAAEGARRAAALTHRLLAFSRQQPLAPRALDVNRLLAGLSELLRRTLGETVSVVTVLAHGLAQVQADPNQLESAILNLAVNARDAMPEGGTLTIETANVHFGAERAARDDVAPGQYVMVAVRDTGSGMTPEVLERAFEPFFTTKEAGKGTGLGLSQVWGFIKQSGGHAAISSRPGQGTTVSLYLPQGQGEAEPAAPAPVAEAPPRGAARGETILVVEDEDMLRRFSVATLREAGYRVVEAADGPAGLAALDAHPETGLLFTDVVLRGPMNGRQVADAAWARRPGLPVLFTTGYTRDAIVHQGRLDEGVTLIAKPFTATALLARVRDLLDGALSEEPSGLAASDGGGT